MQKTTKTQIKPSLYLQTAIAVSLGAVFTMTATTSATSLQDMVLLAQTNNAAASAQASIGIKQRIQNIRNDIVNATKNNATNTISKNTVSTKIPFARTRLQAQALQTMAGERDPFADISTHPARNAIIVLASHNIIDTQSNKFYPDNYIRLGEVVKMLVNSYAQHVGRRIDLQTIDEYMAFARDNNLIYGNSPHAQLSYDGVNTIVHNFTKQFILPEAAIIQGAEPMTRGDFASYVVNRFDMQVNEQYLLDIYTTVTIPDIQDNEYEEQIQTLARLGIIDNTEKFYPNALATRADFVRMFALTQALLQGEDTINESANIIADVSGELRPYVSYKFNEGMRNYLLSVQREQYYLYPHKNITKHEVYHMLQQYSDRNITYSQQLADRQTITKGELAATIVQALALDQLDQKQQSQMTTTQPLERLSGLLSKL